MGQSRYKIYEPIYPHFLPCIAVLDIMVSLYTDIHSTAGAVEWVKELDEIVSILGKILIYMGGLIRSLEWFLNIKIKI